MSEGDVKPPTMVVAEARNIGGLTSWPGTGLAADA